VPGLVAHACNPSYSGGGDCICSMNRTVRVQGRPPPERTKDTRDKGSHKARFISSRLGSEHPPDAAGFNKDPERKV
jgi:hypothetical protein